MLKGRTTKWTDVIKEPKIKVKKEDKKVEKKEPVKKEKLTLCWEILDLYWKYLTKEQYTKLQKIFDKYESKHYWIYKTFLSMFFYIWLKSVTEEWKNYWKNRHEIIDYMQTEDYLNMFDIMFDPEEFDEVEPTFECTTNLYNELINWELDKQPQNVYYKLLAAIFPQEITASKYTYKKKYEFWCVDIYDDFIESLYNELNLTDKDIMKMNYFCTYRITINN